MDNFHEAIETLKVKVTAQMKRVDKKEISLSKASDELGMTPSEFQSCYNIFTKQK